MSTGYCVIFTWVSYGGISLTISFNYMHINTYVDPDGILMANKYQWRGIKTPITYHTLPQLCNT